MTQPGLYRVTKLEISDKRRIVNVVSEKRKQRRCSAVQVLGTVDLRFCFRIDNSSVSHDVLKIVRVDKKACPCDVYPLIPHFYITKLGFAGVYLFFFQNKDCGYSLEPPRQGGSNEYPQSMF